MGDFNSRLGKLDDSDYVNGVSDYVGRHGMGKRNHNGHYLLNFMCRNDLFAANTLILPSFIVQVIGPLTRVWLMSAVSLVKSEKCLLR